VCLSNREVRQESLRREVYAQRWFVAGSFHKLFKLFVRHFRLVHPEAVDVNAMDRQCIARDSRHAAWLSSQ
jgi:hypothetical protein